MAYALNKAETDFCREYARSLVRAEEAFIDRVVEISGISDDDAGKVFAFYKKEKLIKFDRTNSYYFIKHGGLMDKDVILRVLAHVS